MAESGAWCRSACPAAVDSAAQGGYWLECGRPLHSKRCLGLCSSAVLSGYAVPAIDKALRGVCQDVPPPRHSDKQRRQTCGMRGKHPTDRVRRDRLVERCLDRCMDMCDPHRPRWSTITSRTAPSTQPGRRGRSRRLVMARGWASLALRSSPPVRDAPRSWTDFRAHRHRCSPLPS